MSEIGAVRKRLEQALAVAHAVLEAPGPRRVDDVRLLAADAMAGARRRQAATLAESHELVELVGRLRSMLALLEARPG